MTDVKQVTFPPLAQSEPPPVISVSGDTIKEVEEFKVAELSESCVEPFGVHLLILLSTHFGQKYCPRDSCNAVPHFLQR
jgi:hypothetical protein